MSWFRPIDVWFSTQVLPHESHYVRQARRWSRNAEEASDLVQEAYLKLLQHENWAAIRDPRAYTVTTIRNLVLQRVRREQVVAITDIPPPSLAEMLDEAPGVFEQVAAREALLALLEEVGRLPPVCQRVIRMRKFEDQSPREIALALGIGVSTVETHLARGMQQLMNWRLRTAQLAQGAEAADAPNKPGDAKRFA
ncbi:MAG: RNA polymerase sigma factor [Novosphingobium sp.]|nr:RNA polymerase sigma factor [Novosphingobium sp.]